MSRDPALATVIDRRKVPGIGNNIRRLVQLDVWRKRQQTLDFQVRQSDVENLLCLVGEGNHQLRMTRLFDDNGPRLERQISPVVARQSDIVRGVNMVCRNGGMMRDLFRD